MKIKMGYDSEDIKKTKFAAYIALAIVVITWGLAPIFGKYMLSSYSPGVKRLLDVIFATAALGLIANKQLVEIDKSSVRILVYIGVLFALALLFEGIALNYTTPAKSTFYGNVTCITVPIFVAMFTRKLPSIIKVLSGLICLLGFGVIVFGDTIHGGLPSFALGDGLTLVSGIFYGATVALTGTYGKKMNSLVLTFFEFCISIPVCIFYVLLFENVVFSWKVKDLLIVAVVAIIVQAVCWVLRNFAVRYIEVSFVAIITSFSTIVSGGVSILVGMDDFSWSLIIGGLICMLAVVLSGLSNNK